MDLVHQHWDRLRPLAWLLGDAVLFWWIAPCACNLLMPTYIPLAFPCAPGDLSVLEVALSIRDSSTQLLVVCVHTGIRLALVYVLFVCWPSGPYSLGTSSKVCRGHRGWVRPKDLSQPLDMLGVISVCFFCICGLLLPRQVRRSARATPVVV